MAEPRNRDEETIPELQKDRDTANDDPTTHESGTDTGAARPDHSEREWGGDQDIDTAGQVPGNMATDVDDATGF
jgi:hypothetical protein